MRVASFFAPRYDVWGCDYFECLDVLQASCDRLGLRHEVITDRQLPGFDSAIYDLPENLMQALIEGQRQHLAAATEPVLLVGADCILTRDPNFMLDGCDMAVTVHGFDDCVLNTGAIVIADGPRAAWFWSEALGRNPIEWGDDQKALKSALDPVTAEPAIGRRNGVDINFLPCKGFNWAPEAPDDDAGMPVVVHFRGPRKAWMKGWAKRFLQ